MDFDDAMVRALRRKDVLGLRHGYGNVPCLRTFAASVMPGIGVATEGEEPDMIF